MISIKVEEDGVSGSIDGTAATQEDIAHYLGTKLLNQWWTEKSVIVMGVITLSILVWALNAQTALSQGVANQWYIFIGVLAISIILILRRPILTIQIEGNKEVVKATKRLAKEVTKRFRPFSMETTATHKGIDKKRHAGADRTIERIDVACKTKKHVKGNIKIPYYKMGNSHLLFFPSFMVVVDRNRSATTLQYTTRMLAKSTLTMPMKKVPKVANIEGTTWAKLNANGSRDKRFKGNYKVAAVTVYEFQLQGKFPKICTLNPAISKSAMTFGLFQYKNPDPSETPTVQWNDDDSIQKAA